ncbi:MAG: AAA family ATPase, partial [Actinomycetota bacterium]|nr:AAA family ATPase [Actinomycetota bacterium]
MAEPQWRVRLVGRAIELGQLDAERRRAGGGEFRCVLVRGDPGVGKSRLVTEFLQRNRRRCLALTARASPLGATNSFGLWAEALEAHLSTLTPSEISDLCGGFMDDLSALLRSVAAARGSAIDREPPKVRLFEGISALAGKLGASRPLTIFLDDVHLADASSWEELGYLGRHAPSGGVLVIIAARLGELAVHPVAGEILFGLEQEGMLTRLDLAPLDREELVDLATEVMGHHPSSKLEQWLSERSRGNPLFALSLIQGLLDENVDLSAPGSLPIPRELTERIALRLKSLTEAQRATLELLAVMGGRVPLQDLVMLSGRPLETLATILEQLVEQRLVVEQQSGRTLTYELAHPLIQESIYESIGAARRRALHRATGRSLLSSGHMGASAPHFALSADVGDDEAIDALCGAVRQAE